MGSDYSTDQFSNEDEEEDDYNNSGGNKSIGGRRIVVGGGGRKRMSQQRAESSMIRMIAAISELKGKIEDKKTREEKLKIIINQYEQWDEVLEVMEERVSSLRVRLDQLSSWKPSSSRTKKDDNESSELEKKLQLLELYLPKAKEIVPNQPFFIQSIVQKATIERLKNLRNEVKDYERVVQYFRKQKNRTDEKQLQQQEQEYLPLQEKLLRDTRRKLQLFEKEVNCERTDSKRSSQQLELGQSLTVGGCRNRFSQQHEQKEERMNYKKVIEKMKRMIRSLNTQTSDYYTSYLCVMKVLNTSDELENHFEDASIRKNQIRELSKLHKDFEKSKRVFSKYVNSVRSLISQMDAIPSSLKNTEFLEMETMILHRFCQIETHSIILTTSEKFNPSSENITGSLIDHVILSAAEKRIQKLQREVDSNQQLIDVFQQLGKYTQQHSHRYQVLLTQSQRKLDIGIKAAKEMGIMRFIQIRKDGKLPPPPKLLTTDSEGKLVTIELNIGDRNLKQQETMIGKRTKCTNDTAYYCEGIDIISKIHPTMDEEEDDET